MRRTALCFVVFASLLACNTGCGKSGRDSYDESKMDLKPVAARVSSTRHTGPLFEGAALSHGPKLEPLKPDKTKTIRLDTIARILEIAPGIRFVAWTFGGQV